VRKRITGAGVFGVEHVGAGCRSQQAAHELRIVGVRQIAEAAAASQGLQNEGTVGFAFGSR
jgi:hypothetical protein